MSVSAVNTASGGVYDAYGKKDAEKTTNAAGENGKAQETPKAEESAKTGGRGENDPGAVYEKSEDGAKKATYSVNKMSADDRAALVKQLKADQESRKQSLVNIVHSMMGKQADAYAKAGGDDSMWRFLAGGDYKVDSATRAQARRDIAEDGYWGVKQTSQRLFDFASALAGDNVEKMKEMQAAMEKGFRLATKSWGRELPGICGDTMAAANKLFDDYYASKTSAEQ